LASGSFVITLLLLEIALTIFSYFFYPRLIISDQTMDWIYTPTAGTIQRHDRGGQVNDIAIISEGFRDTEF
jgi:CBS domain containing-hemolysin-like protein